MLRKELHLAGLQVVHGTDNHDLFCVCELRDYGAEAQHFAEIPRHAGVNGVLPVVSARR
jgi:hypothetical protein